MVDISALKARLSDPREVARLLGLRVEQQLRNGILARCPVHNNKSGALRLQVKGGALKINCFGCGIYGDAIDLVVAMEGNYKRGLDRAAQLVGGSVAAPMPVYAEPERCDPDVYHDLAERILDAGKLDGRVWTREVGEYLERRGIGEFAYTSQWAALPSLGWLVSLAGDRELLVKAKLARWTGQGEFVAAWPAHQLVIPWRGPGGRICALQRRRVTDGEGPKYVLPWSPEWPYGSESRPSRRGKIAIVEGAVDTLAMRALHPSFEALGIPGIGAWRASWAGMVTSEVTIRIALDRGKPGPDGIVQEDRAAARIALDCAGRGQETDRVLDWWMSRWRRGRALGCVLCGAPEAWLCGACGRRRAPVGSDWGGMWQVRSAR